MGETYANAEVFYNGLTMGQSEILFCGQQKCAPNHAYGPMARPYYLMVYVAGGKGIFRTRNTLYHLGRGATFVGFPGEQIFYMADAGEPWHYYWLAFRGDYLGQMLTRAFISPEYPVALLPDNVDLVELYENILVFTMDPDTYVDVKITSLLLDIMYQYIINAARIKSAQVDVLAVPSSIHIDRAIDYIHNNYAKNISVSDVAGYLGITREHFSVLFHRHFKVSPVHFIRNYRLQQAWIFLLTTDASINTISEATGFSDYTYFSKQFRLLYGTSPSQLRKTARERKLGDLTTVSHLEVR